MGPVVVTDEEYQDASPSDVRSPDQRIEPRSRTEASDDEPVHYPANSWPSIGVAPREHEPEKDVVIVSCGTAGVPRRT